MAVKKDDINNDKDVDKLKKLAIQIQQQSQRQHTRMMRLEERIRVLEAQIQVLKKT